MPIPAKFLIIPALLLLGAVPATAQDFGLMDEAGLRAKGGITKADLEAALAVRFKTMDANHDGTVSETEFVNAGLARAANFDSNQDGTITREELRDHIRDRIRQRRGNF